jgi:hypothetical protein
MQQVVAILGILVNLHQFDKQLPDGVLLQPVHPAITVLVGKNDAQGGIKVIADFFPPSIDKSLNDMASLLLWGERGCAVRALFACRWTASGLFLVLIEGVEELQKQLREGQCLGVIARPVGVSRNLSVTFDDSFSPGLAASGITVLEALLSLIPLSHTASPPHAQHPHRATCSSFVGSFWDATGVLLAQ